MNITEECRHRLTFSKTGYALCLNSRQVGFSNSSHLVFVQGMYKHLKLNPLFNLTVLNFNFQVTGEAALSAVWLLQVNRKLERFLTIGILNISWSQGVLQSSRPGLSETCKQEALCR